MILSSSMHACIKWIKWLTDSYDLRELQSKATQHIFQLWTVDIVKISPLLTITVNKTMLCIKKINKNRK